MGTFLKYWLPVFIWLGVIFAGSTDIFSTEHTSHYLVPFLRWLHPQISISTIATIHFALRKLGHLTEYAVLAALLSDVIGKLVYQERISVYVGADLIDCAGVCIGSAAESQMAVIVR